MTLNDRWLLPEGIEEALPVQAAWLERARRELLDLFYTWGYELVMPPFIEYLESLVVGFSPDLDLQTFKLTDQLNGRLLGVRADMTPQVARIDAHMLKREAPARLCYIGTVLRARAEGFDGCRSPLQVGAEVYGHAGIASDVEVIRLMLESLRITGVPVVHMDLGHIGIFWHLARQAGLDTEQEHILFELLQRKAGAEIQHYLAGLKLAAHSAAMLESLVELNGAREILSMARRQLQDAPPPVFNALDYLEQIAQRIEAFTPDIELHFDLAELRGYHYHTGVVFAAFIPGLGKEIARGGRYDEIGKAFGRARPATGFSTDLKSLHALTATRAAQGLGGIFAEASEDSAMQAKIAQLRAAGERVVCALSGQRDEPRAMGCDRRLISGADGWKVAPLNE